MLRHHPGAYTPDDTAAVRTCLWCGPSQKHRTVVSSYAKAVAVGRKTIIIGERINPTGKSKFKQALRDHNLEYILKEGVSQQDNGADVLDVNVGLPEIHEPSMMEEAGERASGHHRPASSNRHIGHGSHGARHAYIQRKTAD